jgi:hypothetical protein
MEHLRSVSLQYHPSFGGFHFIYLPGQSVDSAISAICHDFSDGNNFSMVHAPPFVSQQIGAMGINASM